MKATRSRSTTEGDAFATEWRKSGLKGQQALSPGQRPGCKEAGKFALKGQKRCFLIRLLPFQGVAYAAAYTQGAALGWWLIALSGRLC